MAPSSSRIIHFLEKSGGDYPLTQHHMPERRNHQLLRIEDFKSHKPESFYNKFYIGNLGEFLLISIIKSSNVLLLISMRLIVQKTGVFHTLCTDYGIKKLLSEMFFDLIYIQIVE
jgi:hypothetical protein